ncbi:MAG: CpaF family protein [Thermoleophilia bacterium]|nr:CpaF family protein [Thermoleophilia bacterium]
MSARPDPALVEHLRARLVRESAIAADGVSRATVARIVAALIDGERRVLPAAERAALVDAVADEVVGLGPLEPLLRDPEVTEIMVNGPGRVFAERDGRIHPVPVGFADAAHLLHVIDRILAPLGRRLDEASPMVDARLPDGSRVNAVIPPLALDGPVLTVRRFAADALRGADLVRLGTLTAEMLAALRDAVRARRNILVSGGTGSGKTTTLAAVAEAVPPGERVVTIEDAAELRLPLPHVVRLESRPAGLEGHGAVTIRALVRNALRMRPDRIVVGEVRGGEALDMLAAMTTGHEGSLSTIHASSPDDALRRLQMLALMGDLELPLGAVAEQVASAVDLIVHQARGADGRRRVVQVARVERGPAGPRAQALVSWAVSGRQGDRLEGGFAWAAEAADWRAQVARDAALAMPEDPGREAA